MSNQAGEKTLEKSDKKYNIALRISDSILYEKIVELSKEQKVSVNMAVNMLLGFAFNEADRQNRKFVPKIIFETEEL